MRRLTYRFHLWVIGLLMNIKHPQTVDEFMSIYPGTRAALAETERIVRKHFGPVKTTCDLYHWAEPPYERYISLSIRVPDGMPQSEWWPKLEAVTDELIDQRHDRDSYWRIVASPAFMDVPEREVRE